MEYVAHLQKNATIALPAVSQNASMTDEAVPKITAVLAMISSRNAKPTLTIMESVLVSKGVKIVECIGFQVGC